MDPERLPSNRDLTTDFAKQRRLAMPSSKCGPATQMHLWFVLAMALALLPSRFSLGQDKPAAGDNPTVVQFHLAESSPAPGLQEAKIQGSDQPIYVHKLAALTQKDIEKAAMGNDNSGSPAIDIFFTQDGAKKMAKLTSENIDKRLAIVVDGKTVSAPVIRSTISTRAQISGSFSEKEIKRIVDSLRNRAENNSP
jgi:SecD-like export protein